MGIQPSVKLKSGRAARTVYRPVKIHAHALGYNVPENDITLSPTHRVVLEDYRTSLFLGVERVLCAVKYLVNDVDIEIVLPQDGVEYFHLLLDGHELVISENLVSESLFLGSHSTDCIGAKALKELSVLFAMDNDEGLNNFSQLVLPELKKHEAVMIHHVIHKSERIAA